MKQKSRIRVAKLQQKQITEKTEKPKSQQMTHQNFTRHTGTKAKTTKAIERAETLICQKNHEHRQSSRTFQRNK